MSTSGQLENDRHHRRWKGRTTENFVVYHLDNADLAGRVAVLAEELRSRLYARWAPDKQPRWRPRCQLMIYPSNADLVQMTGGTPKAGSAATRRSRLRPGTLLSTRIHLAADDQYLLNVTLPHEVTHVVVGALLGGSVPLWANEGMATLAEAPFRKRSRTRRTHWAIRNNRHFPVSTLMTLRSYPERTFLFYAQSYSLTRFLVVRAGFTRFIAFLRRAQQVGNETALAEQYGLSTYQQLEQLWKKAAAR